ncbi:MAG: methionyl-tRNA formyltransferase [Desulfovibrio sp.]|nr:methionyl-tRNA formyltransferase [Desulfovibrio sp.]
MAQAQDCRIVFMGTPGFAAEVLEKLAQWPGGRIVAVYTQPDRPRGRGMKLVPSPVKTLAQSLGLEVRQPVNFKSEDDRHALAELRPDIIVAAAYGLLLPKAVLDAARVAPLNVHASLLPLYRGAAPIQRCIMENCSPDAVTGVSIMHMEPSLDTGPVYATRTVPIGCCHAGELTEALARAGAELLVETLPGIVAGTLTPVPQDHAKATHAAKLLKEHGRIDWTLPAAQVDALVRAVTPAPGARTRLLCKGAPEPLEVRILRGHVASGACPADCGLAPGQVIPLNEGLGIVCGEGVYVLDTVRPSGRKDMSGLDFANGYGPKRALLPEEQCGPEGAA